MRLFISFVLACLVVGGALFVAEHDFEDAKQKQAQQDLLAIQATPVPPRPVKVLPSASEPITGPEVLRSLENSDDCPRCPGPSFVSFKDFSAWRAPDGQFYVNGAVNGVPARFMVDSGAATTTLPAWFAEKLGVRYGRLYRTATANGFSDGVITSGLRLSIEGADVGPQDVVFLPNLSGSPLLGQNVLRQFDIRIEGDRIFFKKLRP